MSNQIYNKDLKPITSACLNITNACNFNCRYCFVNHNANYMDYSIAEEAIYWLKNNADIYKEIFQAEINPTVFFFGGEPTLKWDDIIVPLVLKFPEVQYSITTNGFLLDKSKIDFLAEHNFAVMLSMDGNQETQNYNRHENSFEQLDSMIPYLIDKVPQVNFRGTIIPVTCGRTFENILYAQSKGFKKCYFTINIFEQWNDQSKEILEKEIEKYAYYYIQSFIDNYDLINFTPFTNMIKLIVKQKVGVLDNNINIYKCGLGNGYGAIDYKGNIYTCQEIVTGKDNDCFKIGNIYHGIDIEKVYNLRQQIVNDLPMVNNENSECNNCPLNFCCKKNTCQVNNHLCNGHCLIQSYNQCWWNLLLYKYAALSISFLQNLSNFQNYMKQIILEKEG